MSRSRNHSCGCALCKPWKHGFGDKLPASVRRRLEIQHEATCVHSWIYAIPESRKCQHCMREEWKFDGNWRETAS